MIPVHPSRMLMSEDLRKRIQDGVKIVTQKIQTVIGPALSQ